MAKKSKGRKKPVAELTDEEVVQLLVDVVRRLRRVALHPLALAPDEEDPWSEPGGLLRKLMNVFVTVTVVDGQPQSMTTPLPDELQFESLAIRARAFTLVRDRLYWQDALAALDRLTGRGDTLLISSSQDLWAEWHEATGRDDRVRAYFVVTEDKQKNEKKQTDVDLAYAWLYQDLAHGDAVTTGELGIQQRYEAAVGVFSHLAVVALETLHYINALCELGIISLPVGTFSNRVIASGTEGGMKVTAVHEVDVDEDLNEITPGGPLPPSARPIDEVVRELREQGYVADARRPRDAEANPATATDVVTSDDKADAVVDDGAEDDTAATSRRLPWWRRWWRRRRPTR
ncbi:hypothetical protein MGALJ_19740 [Mycobacterium gallinarum]|uniref:Uncharacterized protein n=1 Tax=Mycobacterium gallinarum TaxID=39689 RepID=A0A9W4FEQ5_9MYCO|nr:hypothetical protein [Mycobacterium gallinarum]BBY92305.1 hypothetical protein MGALJ_19740 [Mycobacterium gallinarum]